MKVSIVIPVYNERNVLDEVMRRVLAAPLPAGLGREIIVVDDGSTDGTTQLLERYRDTPLVVIHHSKVNFGKGAALRIGIAHSAGDFILVQDGDLEYDPNDWRAVLQPLVDGRASVVYGSRFAGRPKNMKFANWLANRILTAAANALYRCSITDEATAYKAFRADVLKSIPLRCIRFEFCPEVTAKARRLGHEIHEVPIGYNARGILEGKKIRWQDGVEAIWTLVKYRFAPIEPVARAGAIAQRSAGA
jgi:glycosyltransferase involved in cell wall biosynthesis